MGTRFFVTKKYPVREKAKEAVVAAREEDAIGTTKFDGLHLSGVPGKKVGKYRGWWSRLRELPVSVLGMANGGGSTK
jgi:hypothetical protein